MAVSLAETSKTISLKDVSGATASSDTSAKSSRHASLLSVLSLYRNASSEMGASKSGSQLAFTTDDLQLSEAGKIIVAPPGTKNKRKVVKHGTMTATPPPDVALDPASKGSTNDPSKNTLNVPTNSNSTTGGLQLRARPTVTTILRQHHVLQKAEKKEKDKLDMLMTSNASLLDVDTVKSRQEEKEFEEMRAAEAKRLLLAKLAYERAIAASRKLADEKQKLAFDMRQKEKEWQVMLEEQRIADRERRRAIAEQLQKTTGESKRAVGDMLRYKQRKASQVKKETEQLQAEARLKQQQEDLKKQDRIQQIQAAKLALKRTKETMGNPNQFYRSIAIPEIQIKLRLQKEEESRKLQETRQKIQAAKQVKSVKLIRAMKKIQSLENVPRKPSQECKPLAKRSVSTTKFLHNSLSGLSESPTVGGLNSGDSNTTSLTQSQVKTNNQRKSEEIQIQEMLEELKRLKIENMKNIDSRRSLSAGQNVNGTVRIVGTRNINTSSSVVTNPNSGSNIYNLNNTLYRNNSNTLRRPPSLSQNDKIRFLNVGSGRY